MSGQEDTWIWSRAHFSLSLSLSHQTLTFLRLYITPRISSKHLGVSLSLILLSLSSLLLLLSFIPLLSTFQKVKLYRTFWGFCHSEVAAYLNRYVFLTKIKYLHVFSQLKCPKTTFTPTNVPADWNELLNENGFQFQHLAFWLIKSCACVFFVHRVVELTNVSWPNISCKTYCLATLALARSRAANIAWHNLKSNTLQTGLYQSECYLWFVVHSWITLKYF